MTMSHPAAAIETATNPAIVKRILRRFICCGDYESWNGKKGVGSSSVN